MDVHMQHAHSVQRQQNFHLHNSFGLLHRPFPLLLLLILHRDAVLRMIQSSSLGRSTIAVVATITARNVQLQASSLTASLGPAGGDNTSRERITHCDVSTVVMKLITSSTSLFPHCLGRVGRRFHTSHLSRAGSPCHWF